MHISMGGSGAETHSARDGRLNQADLKLESHRGKMLHLGVIIPGVHRSQREAETEMRVSNRCRISQGLLEIRILITTNAFLPGVSQ